MLLKDIDTIVFDCEVFAHDWLFVFKTADGTFYSFWNDREGVEEFLEVHTESVLCGFNSKHYDQYILKAVLSGCDPEEVKEVNDWIIGTDNAPWEHPFLKGVYIDLRQTDLMDDTQKGVSLKSIEGHLGMSIEESSVPFDHPEPLTDEQKVEVEKYCRHDVNATERLLEIRRGYLETKLHLAELADIDPYNALGMTDPKLAAALFKAEPFEANDERDYHFPERLDYDIVPKEVTSFFERVGDSAVSDEELFASSLETEIGGCPTVFAFGGVHGAITQHAERTGNGRLLLNYDVSSLYPSLMIEYGYVSRAVPDPAIFSNIRDERFAAKKNGDKATADALKSPMNKAYGAMGNPYNAMYDPRNKLAVCISGQLSIAELAAAYAGINGVYIVQLNTDGILISIPEERYEDVLAVNEWWQKQTSLELEEDRIEMIVQKDVNNYAMRKVDGSVKVKGVYLVRGISPIGAWSINNNAPIVADAIKAYLLDGVSPEETIEVCDDPMQFQLIAKASHKYSHVYHVVDNTEVDVQKCNRVFASKDTSLGRLYKVKKETGTPAKIESLPEHCMICNDAQPSISDIDKQWYIELANKRAQDFFKEENNMPTAKKTTPKETADYSSLNVYQKLALARKMYLDTNPTKSGINSHAEYEYFELEDITPAQTAIFAELGLLEQFRYKASEPITVVCAPDGHTGVVYTEALAISTVINTTNPNERIDFQLKWGEMPAIISKKTGKEANTDIQRRGAEQTYMRRYMKMQILDIVETDEIESTTGSEELEQKGSSEKKPAKSASKPVAKRPATASERKAAASKATSPDAAATAMQMRALKKAIKTVSDEFGADHPEVGQYIAELSAETNKLANISKADCEKAIQKLGELREQFESQS